MTIKTFITVLSCVLSSAYSRNRQIHLLVKISLLMTTLTFGLGVLAEVNANPLTAKIMLASPLTEVGQSTDIEFMIELPDGYHGYADKFTVRIVEPSGVIMTLPNISPQKDWFDKFTKKSRRVYEGQATVKAVVELTQELTVIPEKIKAEIKYQACTDQFCLLPKKVIAEGVWPKATPTANSLNQNYENLSKESVLKESSPQIGLNKDETLTSTFVGVFIAGILTSLTPCIFPMIPITLSILSNGAENRSKKSNFIRSWIYVFGIAITYSILGVTAALSGKLFGSSLSSPLVVSILSGLMFLMAASMMGVFEIQLPQFLTPNLSRKDSKSLGYFGIFTTGLAAGVIASPCVGPVLVSVLTLISQTQNAVLGFFLMMTYAIGMSLLLVALGSFNQLTHAIPRSGPWMQYFKMLLGVVMLGMALYYIRNLVSLKTLVALGGTGFILFALFERFFHKHTSLKLQQQKVYFALMMSFGVTGLVVPSGLELAGISQFYTAQKTIAPESKIKWQNLTEQTFSEALSSQKKIIIDFRADWCAACIEMEELTFSSPLVEPFSDEFVWLRFDATEETPELDKWKETYKIVGLPTMVMINSSGETQTDLQLTEFEKPELFVKRLKAFQSR